MVLYFAYGSNMSARRMQERGVRFSSRRHATLDGFKLVFNKASSNPGEGHANIVREEGSVVEGVLYEVDEEGLRRLDECEGYPRHYDRVVVPVRLDDGRVVEAFTYVAQPDATKDGLRPSRRYLSLLLDGCDVLPRSYRERLARTETLDG